MDRLVLFSILLAVIDVAFMFTTPALFFSRVVIDKCSDEARLLTMFREPRLCGNIVVQVVGNRLVIRSGQATGTVNLTDAALGLLKACCQREYSPRIVYRINWVSVSALGILEILLILGLWWRQSVSRGASSTGRVHPVDGAATG